MAKLWVQLVLPIGVLFASSAVMRVSGHLMFFLLKHHDIFTHIWYLVHTCTNGLRRPDGFAKVTANEKYYRPFKEKKEYREALKKCLNLGATLVEFQSEIDFLAVQHMTGIVNIRNLKALHMCSHLYPCRLYWRKQNMDWADKSKFIHLRQWWLLQ